MAETVFILGAGASKDGGAPIMNEFLEVAEDLHRKSPRHVYPIIKDAINSLSSVHAKTRGFSLSNIEDVFTLLEMARYTGKAPFNSIDNLSNMIKTLIADTIEHTLEYPIIVKDGRQNPQAPIPYEPFLKRILSLKDVCVVSFNYDLALDFAFWRMRLPVEYGLSPEYRKLRGHNVPYLKLHGSLNWGYCKLCDAIIPRDLDSHFHGSTSEIMISRITNEARLHVSGHISSMTHSECGNQCDPAPFIVPPTWNKMSYYPALKTVWEHAIAELANSENIIICGYSLPATDEFFKYLFAIGTLSDSRIRRIWIIDSGANANLKERYRKLLGPECEDKLEFYPESFKQGIRLTDLLPKTG